MSEIDKYECDICYKERPKLDNKERIEMGLRYVRTKRWPSFLSDVETNDIDICPKCLERIKEELKLGK